jgi:hypothetical protein
MYFLFVISTHSGGPGVPGLEYQRENCYRDSISHVLAGSSSGIISFDTVINGVEKASLNNPRISPARSE